MNNKRWSLDELDFLVENYETQEKQVLLDKLTIRTWDSIKLKAAQLGLKRYYNDTRYADLGILLNETNESYYWIGFIMADGHISWNNRLKINLSNKDSIHLDKFKNFIKYKPDLKSYDINDIYISIQDTKYLAILRDKFNIKHNKTYIPCLIEHIKNENLLLSLIVGFIDGDGSIRNLNNRKDFNLKVKCHNNWANNLNFMLQQIHLMTNEKCNTEVKFTNDKNKYAYFTIGNNVTLKKLKEKMLNLNIPYMKRKWDIIDLNFTGRYQQAIKNKVLFLEELSNNPKIKVKELSKRLNLSEEIIYKYKKLLKEDKLFKN